MYTWHLLSFSDDEKMKSPLFHIFILRTNLVHVQLIFIDNKYYEEHHSLVTKNSQKKFEVSMFQMS